MAFRNDLEAAQRRLAMLEEELGRARREASEGELAKARLTVLEAELKALRKQLEPEPPVEPAPAPTLELPPQPTPEEREHVNLLVRRHKARERRGSWIAALAGIGVAYALALPHLAGVWWHYPVTVGAGAIGGAYLLSEWRDGVGWTDMIGPVLGTLFGWAIALGTVRSAGEIHVECLARRAAEAGVATTHQGRATSVERLEGVNQGAACSLTIAFVHDPDDVCSKTCDVSLRCGEISVLDEKAVSDCSYQPEDGTLRLERAPKADADDRPIGVELTVSNKDGSGSGVVYHDPGKGRMPWRLELAFGDSTHAP